MNRVSKKKFGQHEKTAERLYNDMARRLAASPHGVCPVDMAHSFVVMCHSQSCGKCVPCRIGLGQIKNLLEDILDGRGNAETLKLLKQTAESVYNSADCSIGFDAARLVLTTMKNFPDDFKEHITKNRCLGSFKAPVPCVEMCPANVDIPGYIALIRAGRYADAVRLIRKDNPMPVACGYICDHPCETHCRRKMLDDSINIRGLKRYAVDHAGIINPPEVMPSTGKRIAVVGGGPCGLSAAFYMQLMGHQVTILERRKQLGGMLRYGIPEYRLPRTLLDADIECILKTGIGVETNMDLGKDIQISELSDNYDAVFVTVGAHTHSSARLENESAQNVMSAVELLRGIGDEEYPDFTGKTVVIIGGGNVAMDATRTSVRLGAEHVYCVYRRRKIDMTAASEEVEGALAEGAELITLRAPSRIEVDDNGCACALIVKPQLSGQIDASGRPAPVPSDQDEERIETDYIIIAIGQKVETKVFEKAGFPISRGTINPLDNGQIEKNSNIFAGGECVTGPDDAIRAIAGGKRAAANIDSYLGGCHMIGTDISIPAASEENKPAWGRINTSFRVAFERKHDFDCIENGLTDKGAQSECSRCLRCDHFGFGAFRGGRKEEW